MVEGEVDENETCYAGDGTDPVKFLGRLGRDGDGLGWFGGDDEVGQKAD